MVAKTHKMFIGGKWVDAADSKTFEDMNPYTGDVYAYLPAGKREDARRAIEAAQKRLYPGALTLPVMSTGASDKVFLQTRGVQCYGIGPLADEEDAAKGFGAHSDQERLLEREIYRFTQFKWYVVTAIAAVK